MDNLSFINSLKSLLQQKIIFDEEEIFASSPYNEEFRQKELEKNTPRKSAILILLYPKDEILHTVLMLRPQYEGKHSGQVSFPGGKKEPEDINLQETALREFSEEMGVSVDKTQIIGKLQEVYIPPSNFLVTPYIAYLPHSPTFFPNDYEVAELIEFPIRMLLEENIIKKKTIKFSAEQQFKTPYFDIQNQFVWGATALILSELRLFLRKCIEEMK
ncbi:MAG: CoA pyrophosphatase [Cytophagales bacterium]|nr:CoA pyrophosphatase [Cytophagales bacterium]